MPNEFVLILLSEAKFITKSALLLFVTTFLVNYMFKSLLLAIGVALLELGTLVHVNVDADHVEYSVMMTKMIRVLADFFVVFVCCGLLTYHGSTLYDLLNFLLKMHFIENINLGSYEWLKLTFTFYRLFVIFCSVIYAYKNIGQILYQLFRTHVM